MDVLVVQWLRLWAHNVGGLGSISGQGTRPYKATLRVCLLYKDLTCHNEDSERCNQDPEQPSQF